MEKSRNVPRKYNMNEEEDVKRWFREMVGYLKCGEETKTDFIHQGTDIDGRIFAFDAFKQLKTIILEGGIDIG